MLALSNLAGPLAANLLSAGSSSGNSLVGFLPLIIIVVAFFFLLVRPQRARQRRAQQTQASLMPGAQVMTTSGIFATVTALDDEAVTVEIAPGVHVRFLKGAISQVVPSPTSTDSSVELPPDDRPPA